MKYHSYKSTIQRPISFEYWEKNEKPFPFWPRPNSTLIWNNIHKKINITLLKYNQYMYSTYLHVSFYVYIYIQCQFSCIMSILISHNISVNCLIDPSDYHKSLRNFSHYFLNTPGNLILQEWWFHTCFTFITHSHVRSTAENLDTFLLSFHRYESGTLSKAREWKIFQITTFSPFCINGL